MTCVTLVALLTGTLRHGTLRHMITVETLNAWFCDACGWKWFARNEAIKPKRCPRRTCRKLATFVPEKPVKT